MAPHRVLRRGRSLATRNRRVGTWGAAFVLLRGLGRMERVPAEQNLVAAASRVYGRDLDQDEVERIGAQYGRWQGYWAHYLRVAG